MTKITRAAVRSAAVPAMLAIASAATAQPPIQPPVQPPMQTGAEYLEPVVPHLVEADLRNLRRARAWTPGDAIKEIPKRRRPPLSPAPGMEPAVPDPLLPIQREAERRTVGVGGPGLPLLNFDGQDFTGVNPPDTVGDVGTLHYIQATNSTAGSRLVIYDKAGSPVAGPFALDSLGAGDCAFGLGDPIVLYDELADRWLLSEFSQIANQLCVYVSRSADPVTGGWYNYAFATPNFPDYPKYAVWPDAYYVTSNESSPAIYALERTRMLAGQPATLQRFTAPPLEGFGFQALTPADVDGPAPPVGTPGLFMRHRDDEAHDAGNNDPTRDFLELFEFDVDFANPANSTFTGPLPIDIAEFDSSLCGLLSFNCFPQPGSGTTLDPLREVIMWRLQYRNFGDRQTLVGNLVTDVDGANTGGLRWFELRDTGNGWALQQEGTFAPPDSTNRWMGATAMDELGNIAVGYNVVDSGTVFPGLRYAGRKASDPAGTFAGGETLIVDGSSANASNRYGEYSAMSVDPSDGCTFWFTGEYNAGATWSTRIASFKFDNCQPPEPPDFDDFLCYNIRAPRIDAPAVSLIDQFDQPGAARIYDLVKARRLCTPASRNGSAIRDAATHLEGYQIRLSRAPSQPQQASRELRMVNVFGAVTLQTSREEWLLVPTAKDPSGTIPPPPDPYAHEVDHFKCYGVKRISGFEPAAGILSDQFITGKSFELRKPSQVCTPVDKNGEGLQNPDNHLLCYTLRIKPSYRGEGIGVNNQLGAAILDITGERELCVPSSKEVLDGD
jgi:hypothetical protein